MHLRQPLRQLLRPLQPSQWATILSRSPLSGTKRAPMPLRLDFVPINLTLSQLLFIVESQRSSSGNELIALTRKLAREQQIAVLFTEHSMDVVFGYADRIVVLARGQLIAEGTPVSVRETPKVQAVYFGSGKTFENASAQDVAA